MTEKIDREQLARRAIVYVRQSTPGQVMGNRESQRRQYGLVERARALGFKDVRVIDDDLGRSGSGLAERRGFQQLVTEVCSGEVGAVLCIESSRLARNGRDWHHLIDFCGLVGAVVIDPDGIHDPRLANDRLLLGLKGSMSEFELSLFKQRSSEAIRAKARRGELRFCLPVGLSWTEEGDIELDADRSVQETIRLTFRKFNELGSIRQVLLWMREHDVSVPSHTHMKRKDIVWKAPVYNSIHGIIVNPMYAGAYAYGKTSDRTRVVQGRARKTRGHAKPMEEWMVLIRDHHPGYISWEQFERNQAIIAGNAHMKQRITVKAGRGGRGLLASLMRCRRCGRMLHVNYGGVGGNVARYWCRSGNLNHGVANCISFGALRVDEAIAAAIVDAVAPYAVEAALEAAEQVAREHSDELQAAEMELEQARYEAKRAARRYEAVDPDNRLVASELEERWNDALARVKQLEMRVAEVANSSSDEPTVDRTTLLALADSLPAVWNSPDADMRLKQRIVRTLIDEIVADVDDNRNEIVLLVHWQGGRHTQYRVPKKKTGQHRHSTGQQAVDVVRRMAGRWPDEQIAATLNRLGLRTGKGNTWNEQRVYSLRHRLKLPEYDKACDGQRTTLTLQGAAERLGVAPSTVRRLIRDQVLDATQVAPGAPFEIEATAVDKPSVRSAVQRSRRPAAKRSQLAAQRRTLRLPGVDDS